MALHKKRLTLSGQTFSRQTAHARQNAPDRGEHRQAAGAITPNVIRAISDVCYWG
jgi:hypothetical protein